jgi:hypothetical protein
MKSLSHEMELFTPALKNDFFFLIHFIPHMNVLLATTVQELGLM